MITTMSDDCDYNFGTFDNFGVKDDQKISHNTILISRYMGQFNCNTWWKRAKKSGQGPSLPPLFGQCPKENVFFLPVRCSLMDSADSWFMITQNLQIFQGRCWAFKDCQNSSLLVKSFHGDLETQNSGCLTVILNSQDNDIDQRLLQKMMLTKMVTLNSRCDSDQSHH